MTLQESLEIFRKACPFTKINVQEEYINYTFDNFTARDRYPLNVACKIIEENNLPLKAAIIGLPLRYLLQITEK